MKVCIIQPPYSLDFTESDAHFRWEMDALDRCDPSMDLIVLPESANVPCLAKTKAQMLESYRKYTDALLKKAAETAVRCGALLFINCIWQTENGLRNTTLAYDKTGKQVGEYFKQHLVQSEMYVRELDKDYSWEHSEPTILEIDGIRCGFLICYDAYFYESFANIARYNPDMIIACSHQRSDSHDALETMTKFCAYNCNAYVIRSSVTLGENSPTGGCSMIAAPDGRVLVNMHNEEGMRCAEIDPHAHYLKPAGFGNAPATHHSYIEIGRRPWKYRPGGSAIVRHDEIMAYPRICAHRGWSSAAPENSLPALGAAISLGADEVEFDLWPTKDGVIVSTHDPLLDRVSDGTGHVSEHTAEELARLDFGKKFSEKFTGLRIPTFEDILKKFACHTVMNVHIKAAAEENLREIIRLVRKYDCEKYVYFMNGKLEILKQLQKLAPDIARCSGAGDPSTDLVDKALASGAKKIQLFRPHFKLHSPGYLEDTIRRAHENGLAVNYFYTDDPEEARRLLEMGVDTVMTNDYLRVSAAKENLPRYLIR